VRKAKSRHDIDTAGVRVEIISLCNDEFRSPFAVKTVTEISYKISCIISRLVPQHAYLWVIGFVEPVGSVSEICCI